MKIIITGASDGLGLELSKKLFKKRYKVIGISRTKPNIDIDYIKCDLTRDREINKAIDKIKEKHSDFKYIINCAGILSESDLKNINFKDIDNLFKVNIQAPIKLISSLIKIIKKNEADIINIGSTFGVTTSNNVAIYTSTKWALEGFNKNLQLELMNTRCRVIGFNPGGFQSNLQKKTTGKDIDLSKYIPTDKLADLIIYLMELLKCMEVSNIIVKNKMEYHF